jgi:hypothetical protein
MMTHLIAVLILLGVSSGSFFLGRASVPRECPRISISCGTMDLSQQAESMAHQNVEFHALRRVGVKFFPQAEVRLERRIDGNVVRVEGTGNSIEEAYLDAMKRWGCVNALGPCSTEASEKLSLKSPAARLPEHAPAGR